MGAYDVFIPITMQSLLETWAHAPPALPAPAQVVLHLVPAQEPQAGDIAACVAPLSALRAQGFRVALGHGALEPRYAPWWPLAHYVEIDVQQHTPDQVQALARAAQRHTTAKLWATAVSTPEQFSHLSACGVSLFQGAWASHPAVIKNKAMAPGQASVLQLINLVRKQASMDEIETVLRTDAMLGFKLMRLINSSGFGRTHEVASFRHAVMLLGLDRLFRWTALLLTVANQAGAPAVVGTTAVVRGRMMELLATSAQVPAGSAEEGENAFTVGLFSLLDDMLGLPMDQALALLPLPPAINEALRYGTGRYGPWLALTRACEHSDPAALRAAAQAANVSAAHTNTIHMQALAWAANLAL
jgi:EAL and modified HD-GYP domain-containing signal transduction protein